MESNWKTLSFASLPSTFSLRTLSIRTTAMVKLREEVIAQFNELVNMSNEELEAWLDNPMSKKAGTGVGIENGHKIVEILRKNPDKDPEKYEDEDIDHMRKVVGYNSRHLAQEDHLKETKTTEELEKAKSTISLKNWGHDPIKTLEEDKSFSEPNSSYTSEGTTTSTEAKAVSDSNGQPKVETSQGGSKRKLTDKDDDEGAADKDEDASAVDGDDGLGRPRKKSKTTGKSVDVSDEGIEANDDRGRRL